MARKTQPLDIQYPWKDPEPHQEGAHVGQRNVQQEVAQGPAPEPILNGIQGGDGDSSTQEQPQKYYFWKKRKTAWKGLEAIEKFTFCLVVFTVVSSTTDVYQTYLMRESLVVSQRPAVYLGLPDGKVGEFASGGKGITLYFRNYGQTTARNTIIETWPVIAKSKDPSIAIPPPGETQIGFDAPPGFPIMSYLPNSGATREELESREKALILVGRVRYADAFRTYCEPLGIYYVRGLPMPFILGLTRVWDLCDRSTDHVLFRSEGGKDTPNKKIE